MLCFTLPPNLQTDSIANVGQRTGGQVFGAMDGSQAREVGTETQLQFKKRKVL